MKVPIDDKFPLSTFHETTKAQRSVIEKKKRRKNDQFSSNKRLTFDGNYGS